MYPVTLHGARTILREFHAGDLDAVHAIVGDERVTATLSFDPRSREQAEAMLAGILARARHEPRTEYYLAVCLPDRQEAGGPVGFARLATAGVQAAKLGYAIHPDHWRRGLATDAARTLIDFGFRELGLHRISAAIGPDSTASQRTIDKLGFTHEGRIRDHVYTHGAWRDSLLYSLLIDEWRGRGLSRSGTGSSAKRAARGARF